MLLPNAGDRDFVMPISLSVCPSDHLSFPRAVWRSVANLVYTIQPKTTDPNLLKLGRHTPSGGLRSQTRTMLVYTILSEHLVRF